MTEVELAYIAGIVDGEGGKFKFTDEFLEAFQYLKDDITKLNRKGYAV